MTVDILEEDVSGDLQFSIYEGDNSMWLEHDQNGDVQFALYQQGGGGGCPPQPDVHFLTTPCEFRPNVIDLRDPNATPDCCQCGCDND